MKTPVRIFVAPDPVVIEEARMAGKPFPPATELKPPPFSMVEGRPGSDEAKRACKDRLLKSGYRVRSVNHTPKGEVLAYVAHPDEKPLGPPERKPRSSIPRKVR